MSQFKDHFSGHADRYGTFRPTYPAALFEYLASLTAGHHRAWDCATGNGQAAAGLATYFDSVIATDASQKQLDQAVPHGKVRYLAAPAEDSTLEEASIDLVTVAQALHWLDLPKFFEEVRRVCKPEGVFAAWCYQLHRVTPEIDAIVYRLYSEILGSYWAPERRLVEEGYASVAIPFQAIVPPAFEMTVRWNLDHLLGYLDTWSSSQRYRAERHEDPRALVRPALEAAWGDPAHERLIVWPLFLRIGRVAH
jgi:SAM-dependent methyltransferase